MKLYDELAVWWPLLSPPAHYEEEIADILPTLREAPDSAPRTLLELGCGGGSMAFHLKRHFALTLTDLSPAMLDISRTYNPECQHLQGDMRTLDLGRTFDLVMIHDAIGYLTDKAALTAAFRTAHRHCRPGGAVVMLPDHVTETYAPTTEDGGEDAPDGRGLRYLEWSYDANPADTTYDVFYAFLLRQTDGRVSSDFDHHTLGLFPRAAWLEWLHAAGFAATSRIDPWNRDVFVARR